MNTKTKWFYAKLGKQFGPITAEELKELANQGKIIPSDFVWKTGLKQWVRSEQIKGLYNESSRISSKKEINQIETKKTKKYTIYLLIASVTAIICIVSVVTLFSFKRIINQGENLIGSVVLPETKDGPLGIKFVFLPKGKTFFGWNGKPDSSTEVEIPEDFEMAIYPVTQGQWQILMDKNPSNFTLQRRDKSTIAKLKGLSDKDLSMFPVENVSLDEIDNFLAKLNEQENESTFTYRLPSEWEWEYACRGGATTLEECSYHFYFEKPTNELSSKQANFNGDYPFPYETAEMGPYLGRTTKVGSYSPNKLGIYDMHGNIEEITNSLFREGATHRVCRGGSWESFGGGCRASSRAMASKSGSFTRGFRVVRVKKKT